MAREYYGCPMAGFSIPAAEHSTITAWGREGELDAYDNMLRQYPTGLVAVVSDSFDVFRACSELWGKAAAREGLSPRRHGRRASGFRRSTAGRV